MTKETAATRRKRHGEAVTAPPYTALQCPECHVWLYAGDGPWAEGGDRTKPIVDFMHYETAHADLYEAQVAAGGALCHSIPYFHWNDETVKAVRP